MRRRRKRNHFRSKVHQKRLVFIRLLILFLFFTFALFGLDRHIRPIIQGLAQSQAILLSTNLINDSISSYVSSNKVTYDSLMTLSKNTENKVTSIEANALNISALKANISLDISNKLREITHQALKVPIGTLLGGEFLSGRGPKITFYISLSGNVKTDVSSEFYDAGINQTIHSIAVNITASVFIVCPGYNTSTTVETNMLVAETVIVGEVPGTYNRINTSNPNAYVQNYPMFGNSGRID